uniref:Uncharacterized protein n=1 Tax=Anguilla anguilla TaxID=7936 RepID=A0A0E9XWC4_ANGAN
MELRPLLLCQTI